MFPAPAAKSAFLADADLRRSPHLCSKWAWGKGNWSAPASSSVTSTCSHCGLGPGETGWRRLVASEVRGLRLATSRYADAVEMRMVDGSGEAVSGCGVVAVSNRVVCGVCVWRGAALKAPCTGCGVYVWRVGWRVSHSEYRAQS
eukprot:scaffold5656_cov155-Isochrysis_galbana.AAC.1